MIPENTDLDVVTEELKKFYRQSKVERSEIGPDTIFVVDPYHIRDTENSTCRVAMLLQGGNAKVLVDSSFERLGEYRKGAGESINLGGTKWQSILKRYYWEAGKPSYWFLERNLTEFFRS